MLETDPQGFGRRALGLSLVQAHVPVRVPGGPAAAPAKVAKKLAESPEALKHESDHVKAPHPAVNPKPSTPTAILNCFTARNLYEGKYRSLNN